MPRKLLLALLLTAFTPAGRPWFSGCITYRIEARNGDGEVIETFLGEENKLYAWGNSYKLYAAKNRLLELYNGKTNAHQSFGNDGKQLPQADTSRLILRPVAATCTVLGYQCQAVQVLFAGGVSTVFFSPALRLNPAGFGPRALGSTAAVLRATKGALPLRVITVGTATGFALTSEAMAVQPLPLTAADFTPTAPAR